MTENETTQDPEDPDRHATDASEGRPSKDFYNLVGLVFADKYRVERQVASGGFSTVYKALHIRTQRTIALKILRPDLITNADVLKLFEQEAALAGRLRHPNIVDIFDSGIDGDTVYIAMEWLDGHTLQNEIDDAGYLSIERTAFILRQVTAAIVEAHSKHIIHCDLKPQNIVIAKDYSGQELVKVLDFGIGRILSGAGEDVVGILAGTLAYSSPEQWVSGAIIDGRSDVYSLGVTLFQMLTGRLPFSLNRVRDKDSDQPLSLCSQRPEMPVGLDDLVSQMLEIDPSQRPRKIEEIFERFELAIRPANTKRDPFRLAGTTLFGKYRLDEFTDSGGIGAVYRAQQTNLGKQVAIKILKPEESNADSVQRFEREARVAKTLRHPHIVEVIDSGTDEEITFLVMEWLNGRTLEAEIEKEGAIPLKRSVGMLSQICDALEYAHSCKVIHLDVKPSNIFLLSERTGEDRVKVIDFGLAKVLDTKSSMTVTRFGGTYVYCAPEQFGGKISRRSDIFSLGITLYHMLTGVLPFGGSYINAKINNRELPPVPSIRRMCPDIPNAIERVVFKAISKDPKERQQNAKTLFQEFVEAASA
jgi:serine/threonine protein kinase